jgi:hypothetical protein
MCLVDSPNEVLQLATPHWGQYHYGQTHSWAPALTHTPVSLLQHSKLDAFCQGPGGWQTSQHESQKAVFTSTHGLSSTDTKPMPRELTLQSEMHHRPRKCKRTEYAMWVGSIDPTATLDELYRFFRQIDSDPLPPSESAVVSIYMTPKNRCAFVNYKTEPALLDSIRRFHGMRLFNRPGAPRLACRRKEQSLTVDVLPSSLDGNE